MRGCETIKSYPGSLFQELQGLESYKIRQIVHLNTKQEYLTVCFDFRRVCLHRFSTIFLMSILGKLDCLGQVKGEAAGGEATGVRGRWGWVVATL